MPINQHEAEEHRSAKNERCCDQSGQKLPCHQQLTANRQEEIIVQAFFHDFSAEQPCEKPHAAKKDSDAQIKYLESVSQHARVFLNAAITSHGAGKRVDAKDNCWKKS